MTENSFQSAAIHFEELEPFSEEGRGTHQQNVAYAEVLPDRLAKSIQFLGLAPASFIKRPKLRPPLLLTEPRVALSGVEYLLMFLPWVPYSTRGLVYLAVDDAEAQS